MATTKQVQAAKQNVKAAQKAARKKRTIANLPASTRRELGKQAARGAAAGSHVSCGQPTIRLASRRQAAVSRAWSKQTAVPHSQIATAAVS